MCACKQISNCACIPAMFFALQERFASYNTIGLLLTNMLSQGVPIRVEIGPRDVKDKSFIAVVRDMRGVRQTIANGNAVEKIRELLEEMHTRMFER